MNEGVPGGGMVELRAIDEKADLPTIDRWLRSPHIVRWWGSYDLRAAMPAQRSRDTDALITVDREPVGYVCWQRPSRSELAAAGLVGLPVNLVDIDILIGEPEFLGRGVAPRALRLLLTRLGSEGVEFAGVGTSTSNRAAIRAFEKAGFRAFQDFEDPQFGSCRYLLAHLNAAVDPRIS